MKMTYSAPITEIIYVGTKSFLNQDSTGTQEPWEDPNLGANNASFEEEEISTKNLWDD